MIPTTSHRTERVLERVSARTRPFRQTPLQPRDKLSTFELRHLKRAYARTMSQPHDNLMEREQEFARWLNWVAAEKKRLYGWNTDTTVERSSIERATWYRWKKISKPGNMPRPVNLDEFCKSLGLDPEIPYRILGWGKPSPKRADLPLPESPLDRQIRLIKAILDRNPPSEERRRLERAYVRAKRQREELRLMDEEIAELLSDLDAAQDEES